MYVATTLATLRYNPAFLLIDVAAPMRDDSGDALDSGYGFLAIYVLAPEKLPWRLELSHRPAKAGVPRRYRRASDRQNRQNRCLRFHLNLRHIDRRGEMYLYALHLTTHSAAASRRKLPGAAARHPTDHPEAHFRTPAYLPDRPDRLAPCRGHTPDVTLRRP